MNFSFPNYLRFFEFVSDYLYNLNSYLKLVVFNISENFEFARKRIRKYYPSASNLMPNSDPDDGTNISNAKQRQSGQISLYMYIPHIDVILVYY